MGISSEQVLIILGRNRLAYLILHFKGFLCVHMMNAPATESGHYNNANENIIMYQKNSSGTAILQFSYFQLHLMNLGMHIMMRFTQVVVSTIMLTAESKNLGQ